MCSKLFLRHCFIILTELKLGVHQIRRALLFFVATWTKTYDKVNWEIACKKLYTVTAVFKSHACMEKC